MTDEKAKTFAKEMTPHVRALVDAVVTVARKHGVSERYALDGAIYSLRATALFIDLKDYDPETGKAHLRC